MHRVLVLIHQVGSEHPVLDIHRTLNKKVLSDIQKGKVILIRHSDVAKSLDETVSLIESGPDFAAIAYTVIIHTHQLIVARASLSTDPHYGVVWVICVEVEVGGGGNKGVVSPEFELDSRIIW